MNEHVASVKNNNANSLLTKLYRNPNYAIVKIPESSNVLQLYQLLLTNGFPEVSFVNEVRENAFLPSSDIVDMIHQQIAAVAPNSIKNENMPDLTTSLQIPLNGIQCSPNSLFDLAQGPSSNGSEDCGIHNQTSSSRIPSPFPYVARPRGSRVMPSDDTSVYAICQLCSNKIMASRLSNLTNHVRRHASLKQYQCRHCVYAHNEMAKVRLHMQHNHRDFDSQPIDAICPEMQMQWNLLMEQCFPGHAKRISTNQVENNTKLSRHINMDGQYPCVECGEIVIGNKILEHLHERHQADCTPYSCAECSNYTSSNQWKVRLHITVKHPEKAAEITVNTLPAGSNYTVFIRRFFPDIPGRKQLLKCIYSLGDDEEEKMVAELRENSVKLENGNNSGDIRQDLNFMMQNERLSKTSSDLVKDTIRCQICHRNVPSAQPLFNLLSHAKRHSPKRQFQCPVCNHSTVDHGAIKHHMAIKHPSAQEPQNNFSEELHTQWITTLKQCFPKLIPKIESHQFRFEYYCQHHKGENGDQEKYGQESTVNQEDKNSIDEEEELNENLKEKEEDQQILVGTSPPPAKRLREKRTTSSGSLNVNLDKNLKSNKLSNVR